MVTIFIFDGVTLQTMQLFAFKGQNMKSDEINCPFAFSCLLALQALLLGLLIGLVPKFTNGKKCIRKLEKLNIRLKPETLTDYLFSPRRILNSLPLEAEPFTDLG